jgi:polysaccharide export outer membrane protein
MNNLHLHKFVGMACLITLTGCTFLPSSGPSAYKIRHGAGREEGEPSYQLLKVDNQVLGAIRSHSKGSYQAAGGRDSDKLFGTRGLQQFNVPTNQGIAVGDVISVAIYERDSALFGPSLGAGGPLGAPTVAMSPMTALPPQTVDHTGEISVPFIGRVKAAGRTPSDVESAIREGLRMKTPDPQVVVSLGDRKGGDLISVAGDVQRPGQFPVSLAGMRLVDAIAAAGGSKSDPYNTMVTVTRGSTTRSDSLQQVFSNSSKNVPLRPGDTVVLRDRPLTFRAFGETGKVGNFPIQVEDLTLTDAVAASGGPSDMSANPASIFVYRMEPASLLASLGRTNLPGGSIAPVVYQLDLTDPKGFFYANNFTIRDQDIIYYSAAGSVGVRKFMGLINTLLAPAIGGAGAASSASILAQ